MGQQFTASNNDANGHPNITQAAKALTGIGSGFAAAAGELIVTVGDNLFTDIKRKELDIAIQQISDVLREAQWPDGALATDYGYLLATPDVKGSVVVGSIAAIADDTFTEDSVAITYNGFADAGSSLNYGNAVDSIRDFIREALSDG